MWPPAACKDNKSSLKLFRAYSAIVLAILIAFYAVCLVPAIRNNVSLSSVIETLSYTSLMLSSIKNIFDSAFLHPDNCHAFLDLLDQTEQYVKLKVKKHQTLSFDLELIVIHALLLVTFCFDTLTWLIISNDGIVSFALSTAWYYLEIYSVWITLLLVRNYSGLLKCYLKQLNSTLEKLIQIELAEADKINSVFGPVTYTKSTKEKLLCVMNARLAYTHISRTIELFNVIFGWRIVMIFAVALFEVCLTADVLTRVMVTNKNFPIQMIISLVLWTLQSMVSEIISKIQWTNTAVTPKREVDGKSKMSPFTTG